MLSVMASLTLAAAAFAQGETFSAPNVAYSFTLPESRWKMTVKPSDTSPNVEYVYGDRSDGHFEVRKLDVRRDTLLTKVLGDEQEKLQFLKGYVAGKQESFSGRLRGMIFNYEYVRAGRPMGGRMYLLRANDTTVYAIRFSGEKDKLRSLEHQTDSIARTFAVKQS